MVDKRGKSEHRELPSRLNTEQQNELGALIAAIDGLVRIIRPPLERVFIRTLFFQLISTALERMNSSRRMTYLEQWRHFLSSLPDALADNAADERPYVLVSALEQFKVQSMQGKRKPAVFPEGNIRYRRKNGDIWFVRIQNKDSSNRKRRRSVEYLHPLYPPGVLKRQVKSLERKLPAWKKRDLESTERRGELERRILKIARGVPQKRIRAWLDDGHSRSELAHLIGAHRAGMTATAENLPQLYETVRLADGWLAK